MVLSRAFSSQLPDELKSLQELSRKFANDELRPIADKYDKECIYPKAQIKKLGELGLMGIGVSQECGGSGMNALALSIVVEELSRVCGSTGAIVSIHNCLYADLLNRLGSDHQKSKYLKPYVDGSRIGAFALSETGLSSLFVQWMKLLKMIIISDAGSDVVQLSTKYIQKDGNFILNGTKAWVTSGIEADSCIVFATVDQQLKHKGIAAFVVDLNSPGVTKGPNEKKIGMKKSSTCDIILSDVIVPAENLICAQGNGFKIAMEQLDQARIGIASVGLGIAQGSLDVAINYASQRVAFRKPILELPSVQNRLAEMALRVETSRLLVRRAAELKDANQSSTKVTSMAKWHCSEASTMCSHNCIQILGGMGVVEDMPAERFYRDARITEIFGGVTDVQKLIVAGQLRKEYGL